MSLQGKKIIILGVANERSIAHSITEFAKRGGAEIMLTYVNEAIEKRVRPIAEELGIKHVVKCDVQSDAEIDALFAYASDSWGGKIDGVVHSLAFAEREDMANPFTSTTREGFKTALDISAYSLVALAKRAQNLMTDGGSIITLSYLGSEKVVKNYNVMGVAKAALEASVRYLAADLGVKGIRVNAISAGPIKTLAASGIPGLKDMLHAFAEKAPLKRNTSLEDVAGTAEFLLGDLSKGITGEVIHVDCGFNIIGM